MQAQDLALVSFFGVDDPRDPAIAHDHDAVRDAEQFRHFGGDDDDALVLLRQLQDELVRSRTWRRRRYPGSVHPASGSRLGQQPATDDHLLLVATGEGADLGLLGRCLDPHGVDDPLGIALHLVVAEQPMDPL